MYNFFEEIFIWSEEFIEILYELKINFLLQNIFDRYFSLVKNLRFANEILLLFFQIQIPEPTNSASRKLYYRNFLHQLIFCWSFLGRIFSFYVT